MVRALVVLAFAPAVTGFAPAAARAGAGAVSSRRPSTETDAPGAESMDLDLAQMQDLNRVIREERSENTKLRKARHGRRQERPRGGPLRRGGLPSSAEAPLAPTQPRAGGLGRCEAGRGPRQSQELGG